MAYLPVESYGLIDDMRTVALVGMNGSIDWFCYPAFDSPSVFAAILDDKKGGLLQPGPGPRGRAVAASKGAGTCRRAS